MIMVMNCDHVALDEFFVQVYCSSAEIAGYTR